MDRSLTRGLDSPAPQISERSPETRGNAPAERAAASAFPILQPNPVVRAAFAVVGGLTLILAIAGALLPVLPCTPFLLLSAYCFARSIPAMHRWLLRSRLLGPVLADWQRHRALRRHVKYRALAIAGGSTAVGLYYANLSWPNTSLALLAVAIGCCVVWRLPTI